MLQKSHFYSCFPLIIYAKAWTFYIGVFSFFDVYLYVVDMTCCIVTLNDVVSLKLLKSKHIYNF